MFVPLTFGPGERAEFDLGVLKDETGHPYRLQCEQQKLQHLLLSRLAEYPHAAIRFGCPGSSPTRR